MPPIKLYNYWRSSTSYRTRIALKLKGLSYDYIPVNLLKGESDAPDYLKMNPMGGVPTMAIDGKNIVQSLAIIEYLDEKFPNPPLLPKDAEGRAHVRALSYIVATDMHQFANLPVLNYIGAKMGEEAKKPWIHKWFAEGFAALEAMLQSKETGKFCHGDTPTMADACLVPAVFTANRFEMDMKPYPTVLRIVEECNKIKAFQDAHPAQQPDAVK